MKRLGRIGLAVATLGIALLAAAAAWFQEFVSFPPHDDEGYLMLAVRHLLDGHRLYDEVRVYYGPLYFLEKWLLHGPLGLPLTHDAVRLTALCFRLATAALAAWLVGWLTRSAVVGAGVLFVATAYLTPAVNEPGHPQELATLLVAALPLAARPGRGPGRAVAGLALLVAGILLVKVNVGALAGIAVAMALLSSIRGARAAAFLRSGALAAVVLLPWGLMRDSLEEAWVTRLAWLASAWIVALSGPSLRQGGGELRAAHLLGFLATGAAGILAGALFPLALGSSAAAIFDCLVVFPLDLAGYFALPRALPGWSWLAAAAGGGASVLLVGFGARRAGMGASAIPLVTGGKLLLGLGVVLRPDPLEILSGVTPFAWLILLPDRAGPRPWPRQFPRLVLVWLAVLQPLQVYPVAGSQIQCATLAALLCALVGLGDAAASLASTLPAARRRRAQAAVAFLVLAAILFAAAAEARRWSAVYGSREWAPLDLPGSERMRAWGPTAAALRSLVATLRARCTSFVSVPGSNSLYFWTGQAPPTLDLVSRDLRALSEDRVTAIARALEESPAPCLVRRRLAIGAAADPRFEALTESLFRRDREFGPYTLWVRRPS